MADPVYTPVEINALVEKTTPADADNLILENSADSNKWKKLAISNLSLKAQVDLIANSTNYNALAILMKGYKEYTFAIRQSGTDAPTIDVIKDDFGVTALTFSYEAVGHYLCDITTLSLPDTIKTNINVSNGISGLGDDIPNRINVINGITHVRIRTQLIPDGETAWILANGVLASAMGCVISIRETID